MKVPAPLTDQITERDYTQMVVDYCRWRRLLVYHTHDSRHSASGFPDLVIVGNVTIFVELKSAKGKVSPAQHEWITRLYQAGAIVYLWRPADWPAAQRILADLCDDRVKSNR